MGKRGRNAAFTRWVVLSSSVGLAALLATAIWPTGSKLSLLRAIVHPAVAYDVSPPLRSITPALFESEDPDADAPSNSIAPGNQQAAQNAPPIVTPAGSAEVEQTSPGTGPKPELVASFDGLGAGFEGPQGTAVFRNPSDNTLAVGRDYIFQIVNSRMAIFTKKGRKFKETGRVLYGPMPTNTLFKGFGGAGEKFNSGDAVVRYDQLADRWLVVLPIFRRDPEIANPPEPPKAGGPAGVSASGVGGQPGASSPLSTDKSADQAPPGRRSPNDKGAYAMCYAISVGPDPLGAYYRYEFIRPLFPDYPRPAIWPDGYYIPTSTGDDVIQKQACVVDRARMLRGEPATEQCVIVDGVNFLNSADIDGKSLPPKGSPNIVLAAGGAQLKGNFEDDGLYAWQFHVNWNDPSKTTLTGPEKIAVAPYHYLCNGQLSRCVPQPDTTTRLDSQGDKIMARVVYRRIGNQESIVATHSINTSAGAGGVRWYELRVGKDRKLSLHQQGTYSPDGAFRWLPSPAIDHDGNIAIGYSFGGPSHYPGQRFVGRLAQDPLGKMTLSEAVLAEGEAPQKNGLRWEDFTQTAIDPSDDRTIWYVGDYLKKDAAGYSSRIGGFRLTKPESRN
ncbi:MAG TPA: hypothetical protein VG944_20610 [Fimbriimonas sp.]|nr:hypothetical protein [Fimbriimonas sp.]